MGREKERERVGNSRELHWNERREAATGKHGTTAEREGREREKKNVGVGGRRKEGVREEETQNEQKRKEGEKERGRRMK